MPGFNGVTFENIVRHTKQSDYQYFLFFPTLSDTHPIIHCVPYLIVCVCVKLVPYDGTFNKYIESFS